MNDPLSDRPFSDQSPQEPGILSSSEKSESGHVETEVPATSERSGNPDPQNNSPKVTKHIATNFLLNRHALKLHPELRLAPDVCALGPWFAGLHLAMSCLCIFPRTDYCSQTGKGTIRREF